MHSYNHELLFNLKELKDYIERGNVFDYENGLDRLEKARELSLDFPDYEGEQFHLAILEMVAEWENNSLPLPPEVREYFDSQLEYCIDTVQSGLRRD